MLDKINNLLKNSIVLYHPYNKNLSGLSKRNIQKNIKKKIIEKFINIHHMEKAKIKNNLINSNNQIWYFSVSHTLGKTFVHFAKQPIGIDCQTIINFNVLKNNSHFFGNDSFLKLNSKIDFILQWTTREAFLKCFCNIYHKIPNLLKWKIKVVNQCLRYFIKKNIFICKTQYCKSYIYTICYKAK